MGGRIRELFFTYTLIPPALRKVLNNVLGVRNDSDEIAFQLTDTTKPRQIARLLGDHDLVHRFRMTKLDPYHWSNQNTKVV